MRNADIGWNGPGWDEDEEDAGHDPVPAGRSRLDRWLGDALIGGMLLIGMLFCVAAARAEVPSGDGPTAVSLSRPA